MAVEGKQATTLRYVEIITRHTPSDVSDLSLTCVTYYWTSTKQTANNFYPHSPFSDIITSHCNLDIMD